MNISISNQHHLRAILRGWDERSMAMPSKNAYADSKLRQCYDYGYRLTRGLSATKAKITIAR